MRSSKVPILVFFTSFSAFVLAFLAIVVLFRPQLVEKLKKYRDREPAAQEPSMANLSAPSGSLSSMDATGDLDRTGTVIDEAESGDSFRFRALVVTEDDQPAQGAQLMVLAANRLEEDVIGGRLLQSKAVDEKGRVEIELKHRKSPVTLVVTAPGTARWLTPRVDMSRSAGTDLGTIKLGAGGPVRVAVRTESDRPISGANVTVIDPSPAPEETRRRPLTGTTDSIGRVNIPGSDFGSYSVTVETPGYSPFGLINVTTDGNPAKAVDIEVVLTEASSYVTGFVRDDAGNVIREGTVFVRPLHSSSDSDERYESPIGRDGTFEAGPLPSGDYLVVANVQGMIQRREAMAEADGNAATVTVEYAGTLEGKLVCNSELPAQVSIGLSRRELHGGLFPFTGPFRTSFDRENASFRIDGVPPGTYQLRISAVGFAPGRSEEFSIEAGEQLEGQVVNLSKGGGQITGRILHTRGFPIAKVRVTAYEGDTAPPTVSRNLRQVSPARSVISDENGNFQLRQLSPGLHFIAMESAGLPTRTLGPVAVTDEDEGVRFGTIIMGGGSSIAGRLLDASGQAVPRGVALLVSADESTHIPLIGDRAGNYTVRGLQQGTYFLSPVAGSSSVETENTPVRIDLVADQHLRADLTIGDP